MVSRKPQEGNVSARTEGSAVQCGKMRPGGEVIVGELGHLQQRGSELGGQPVGSEGGVGRLAAHSEALP